MKRTIVFMFLCFLNSTVEAQEKNPDSLIYKAFAALQTNNEQAYLKLFPDYVQWKTIMNSMAGNMKGSDEKEAFEKEMSGFTKENFESEILFKVKENYQDFFSELEIKKIKLGQLRFVNAFYKIKKSEGINLEITTLNGIINLKDDNKNYELYFSDVIWSEVDKGWFGIKLNDIVEKEQSLREETKIDSVKLELITIEEDRFVPPPPPPKKAKKVKAKASITKTSPGVGLKK